MAMSTISLNASMRTNLLSLQQISKLQDQTQLRLSTGLKVNSALDNPSSFYTSQSLNNRANDLSSLLDAMGQGIETIKAANEGIAKAEDLLEQMKAIAEQVQLQTSDIEEIPDKATIEAKVGANGAVVSTAQELRDAINSGKETICVYGAIDLGDVKTTGKLNLQANQKLVGVNYFGNYGTKGQEFSSITATTSNGISVIRAQDGCLVSDLSFTGTSTGGAVSGFIDGGGTNIRLQNLDFQIDNAAAISAGAGGNITLSGKINIKGNASMGIGAFNSGFIEIASDAQVVIKTTGNGYGLAGFDNSSGKGIKVSGNVQFFMEGAGSPLGCSDGNIQVTSSASLYFSSQNILGGGGLAKIDSGAKIAVEKDGKTNWYEVTQNYLYNSYDYVSITADNITTKLNVSETSAWKTPEEIIAEMANEAAIDEESVSYQNQYNNALSQFDMLINDSSYKSINLLKQDSLKVNFNEDKSANLVIEGVNVTSATLGLTQADWQNDTALEESLNQVIAAKEKLRDASSQLGNYYAILTNREDFTERLINVLEEGADKLTLADMNEESANMLALQTRQQLALTSLSLASQASQSVLNLF